MTSDIEVGQTGGSNTNTGNAVHVLSSNDSSSKCESNNGSESNDCAAQSTKAVMTVGVRNVMTVLTLYRHNVVILRCFFRPSQVNKKISSDHA